MELNKTNKMLKFDKQISKLKLNKEDVLVLKGLNMDDLHLLTSHLKEEGFNNLVVAIGSDEEINKMPTSKFLEFINTCFAKLINNKMNEEDMLKQKVKALEDLNKVV